LVKPIKVGIIGCGVVGTGVVQLLLEQKKLIQQKAGIEIEISAVAARNWNKKRFYEVPKNLQTTDWKEVIEKSDIVVELVGGVDVAKESVVQALKAGKPVVTANKHLIAEYGKELVSLARDNKTTLLFEAAVGGGIPLIKVLKESFVSNNVEEIQGILNGTTNYILTRMEEDNLPFKEALKEAQEKGYAEADPTFDIEGIDAAHKITILANLAFGGFVDFKKVFVEGITNVEVLDIKLGRELDYTLKLLAIAKKNSKGQVEVRVHPTFIPMDNPLSNVRGVFNAVLFKSDYLGKLKLQGAGAGAYPTATAVVQDIVQLAKQLSCCGKTFDITPLGWKGKEEIPVAEDFYSRYYLRLDVEDKPGVLHQIAGILAERNISIAGVLQQEWVLKFVNDKNSAIPLIILTHKAYESQIKDALKEIQKLPFIKKKPVLIRVEEERY
jgi:homoserine dehydrogenase